MSRVSRLLVAMIVATPMCAGAFAREGVAATPFTVFTGNPPDLPLRFEYPTDWEVERSSGASERYTQVQLYGPASLDARLRTYITVRVVPPKLQGGRYADVKEMVDSYRQTLMPTLTIDRQRRTSVLSCEAILLDVSGIIQLPWNSPKAVPVLVKSQRLFFEKNKLFYELSWMATTEAAPSVEPLFAHLLETLALSE